MKKTLSVVLAAMLFLGCTVVAMADELIIQVPLSVSISEMFGFLLDKYSHDFGSVAAGAGAQTTIGIFCRSNHGVRWYMALNADPFENAGGQTIPSNPGFKMGVWSWSSDPSEIAKGDILYTDKPVPALETDFYRSTVAEGMDPMVPLTLGLYLLIPINQPAGYYTTDLFLTMHE